MDYVSKLADRVIDFIVDISIRHLGYIICYKGHVKELKQGIDDLKRDKQLVEHKVDCAKNNVQEIEASVTNWFEKVNEKIKESKDFQDDEAHAKTGCSRGILPFLRYRHKLGRKAKKMTMEVKLLRGESKFDTVSYMQNPRSIDTTLSNVGYVEFESRKNIMDKIIGQLRDSTVRMIGVHGPGGVGKTTFVKEIAMKAKDDNLFDVVVIVNITRNPNQQKIQEDIAYCLGLNLGGEGNNGRADRLRTRLKNENTLLVLDDIWDELDLNMLGIPFDDDNLSQVAIKDRKGFDYKMAGKEKSPSDYDDEEYLSQVSVKGENDFSNKMVKNEDSPSVYKRCKILLTSRIKEVLSDKMNVKENSIFSVTELNDDEAMKLFNKVTEKQQEKSKLRQEIVKKYCAGLPMAILTVGRALKNKSESIWEDALEKLKKQELIGVQKSMEISVKMSYDHLESEELKSIFLLCAQMGHQPSIVELVKYCFGLGILKGVHTLRDARDRIRISIQKLKDSSLMLDGDSNDHFNMHDMVRDAALSIAHKDQNVFTLRNDKLDDWPDKDELERCTTISIYKGDIVDELPKVVNCPQLRVFHIDSDDPTLNIPDRFFEGMEKLRVLILIGLHLPSLPSSIKDLSNLRMLCLERCVVGNLSIIGDLKKLRILSLSGSEIEDWPAELGGLSKLQLLDISDCSIANLIPPNFISGLTSLEELYIRKCLITMAVEREAKQSLISILAELKHLHQLKIMDMCIPSAEILPMDLFFDKLNDYKIVIGDFKMLSVGDFKMPKKYEASRSLALQLKAGTDIHSLKGIKMLFKRVENLLLGELHGVQNALYELNLDGFPDLKHLSIINNIDIEYIVNSMELSHPQDAFPSLESLSLFNLMNIKKICSSPITDASFSRLKAIKVKMCTKLKDIFSFYIVKFLTSLETIDVSECDSLEEIIIDEGEVSNEVKFHKLCSLTLQKLPSFISFYTNNKMLSMPQFMDTQTRNTHHTEIEPAEDEQSVTTSLSLFGETVEIPNLESLNLSSINIHKIWSDQHSSACFQNLIKLIVKDCCKLTYLCSLSVARRLDKLKGLFVSECRMMEKLFDTETNSNESPKGSIFPKLEEIQLTNMEMLEDIWPAEVSANSFPSLISVHIEGCKKLGKIFSSHMEGWRQSLDSLKIVRCESVEVIFEIGCPQQDDAFRLPSHSDVLGTKLQLIHLEGLQNLKQVWSRDPEGVVNFTNLRTIRVLSCPRLSNVLPASVAKGLAKLEVLSISLCDEMEEIVAWVAGSETDDKPLVFPEVISMVFYKLKNIRRFYMGRHTVECPKLKRLTVNDCPKLETFTTESTNEEERPVFSAEKVISNLEYLDISRKEAAWLKSNNIGKYRLHRLKILRLLSLASIEILYWFLHRIPNLERLHLGFHNTNIRELVPSGNNAPQQKLGNVLQLRELGLYTSSMGDLGFERDPILRRIERLILSRCSNLINLAHSSVSLTHLTYLVVAGCGRLKNLMASSTAKSLVQLTTMKVTECYNLKEIVTNEGNEEKTVVDIVFSKLITIELVTLKNITSFCSYKNCQFSFPSLEKVILRDCPKMRTFAEGHTRAPKLQNVLAIGGKEKEKWYWEDDLNATIRKVFEAKVSFEYTPRLELSSHPELEQVWCGKDLVQENSFRNLKTLVVKNCGYLVHVIPSHLLPCFKNLEELVVGSCDAVQVIFNVNDDVTKASGMFRLKKLSLRDLPKLEHVWDKDPEGIVSLQALQDLSVYECYSLKYVFPASVAKDLPMQRLSVQNCKQLVEIFAEDVTASGGDTKSLVFRSLTSLELRTLPELKYFYPGPHMLEFPVLKELYMQPCKWMILNCQEAEAYLEEQVLIPVEKVNPLIQSLEKLSFDMRDAKVTWDIKSQKLELENLLQLQEQSDSVLYRLLQTVPNVEKLEVKTASSLKEMFSEERPDADHVRVLSHLKELRLSFLNDLKSIGLEHSWIHPIPENLQTLEVEKCHNLKNLVPCTLSFSNLTNLVVSDCNNLLFLFTSATAKSLAGLKKMEIRGCTSMQEIVCREGEESHEDGKIIFGQLQALHLERLIRLRCFYSGNYTLCFPSLEEVSVITCRLMKTFCPLIIINLDSVKLLSEVRPIKDATPWEGDINTTIRKMNEKKIAKLARDKQSLPLGRNPLFQEMWHGSVPIPEASFSNLESLVVEGEVCEFLSEVLPANLLPFLNKMQKLEVRNCSSVKTIFDMKCITEDKKMTMGPALLPLPFSLKTLVLEKLPNLECVWNEDPDGVLSVQLLKEVHVDTCQCLTSLFPTSVAKDLVKLENLEVKHCGSLVEIVAGIEAAPGGTNPEFTFPCLASLTLLDLPKLKCFYCSLYCVQFTGQDPHIEDQVCLKEVTPNLANLSLDEKELKMIWHGQCQGDHLHKIKFLDLQCFNVESSELPCGFLEKLPNIETLVVSNSSFKEIFCSERLDLDYAGFLSQLKALKLASLYELNSIGLEHSWVEESFLKNLETLEAKSCSRLRNLVPSSICFSCLMHLTVSNCDDMKHLFTSSTAKSLAQLKQMDISCCRSLQEIVSKEEGESDQDEIIFGQLHMLNLKDLPDLMSFYKGNFTLSFPSLEQLSVINCRRMDTFCAGAINTDKLSAVEFKSKGVATPLKVDLNFTIHTVFEAELAKFVRTVKDLKLGDHPEIHEIWHGSFPVPFLCFTNLKSLVVQGCEFLSNVIPFHILGLLCNLEELVVRQCKSVKVIFEVKDVAKNTEKFNQGSTFSSSSFRLKKLTFEQLPNLEHVWDSISQEVISLQTLQEVYVHGCDSLERLFPASVAKSLVKFEKLEVQQCGRLVEFVAKDEAATEGVPKEFVLENMTSIKLCFLPELKCFYPGPHKLDCPKLKQVNLFHCDKLNIFTCESPSFQEVQLENQAVIPLYPQALFLADKVIPYLEFMALSKEGAMMIWHGQFHVNLVHKLQALQLQCFHDASDIFPYGLLQKVPNIEKLVVSCSSFKEIFCCERPNTDCTEKILSHLKCLQLSSLSELNSTGLEHFWMDPISENLEKLLIDQCHRLRNIVPYKVSFSSLMDLNVSQCGGLVHLFTPSTSKTLCQLKNMSIKNCESLEEIVSEEVEESSKHDEEEIIFHKLRILSLHSLPRLGRFYNGTVALNFPFLEQLSLIDCRRMQSFCESAISVNKWTKVKFEENKRDVLLKVDLNSTIRKAFEETVAKFVKEVEYLELVEHPEVHEIWRGSFPIPFSCFNNLKSLTVQKCEVLSNVIPSHILGLLCNLEELDVRQCHSVKAIFEVKDIAKDTRKSNTGLAFYSSFRLKKLIFVQLPNLEHIWDSDPQEDIGLQNLQEVYVYGCDSLERLFPPSIAKSLVKLEKLKVEQCGRLLEIVAKDEAATEGAPKEFVLPCLTTIELWLLPELNCFYPGPHKLECPKLNDVNVAHCDKLKTFTCESQSFQEAQPEFQVGISLYPQALFVAEKVIPNLEILALNKEEATMIWHGQFHVNLLHKLQVLALQCFHDDLDTFPCGLLQKVPNIETLYVRCSSFKNIFCYERLEMVSGEEILSNLKFLLLMSLSELNSIGLEHSWTAPISENLEELQIDQCHSLRNIVPWKVSFSSLIDLNISQCGGLVYLFTPSTSRTLCQLKNMSVKKCESLEEIVFEEVEESSKHDEEKIIFEKLKTLSLQSLQRLGRFYNGSVALSFPSLELLSLVNCRRIESFCAGAVSVNKSTKVKFGEDEDAVLLEVDLNSTIRKAFEVTAESNSDGGVRR